MAGMALRGLPSLQHPAVGVVMRTVPFFMSIPLNCYSQRERGVWSQHLILSLPGPFSVQSTRRSVPQGHLTWESGETTWPGPWQGSKLIAWASVQPAAARSSGLWRKVPLLTRLGVHSMHKQE